MALTYEEALDYLYSLINYEVQRPSRYAPEVVSLERPRALLGLLGDPQRRYPVIHLTGTKGKGSVSAMCAASLSAAGLRTGLYSSPHLQDFRERFQVNGALIERDLLAALVERVQPAVAQIPGLTWFEVVTALAFMAFAEMQVDVAVIEVGLGGRLDATNILEKPLVSVITSLSYDHMHLLGNTLAEIAFEKAGIIKPGVPVVSAPQPDEALAVLERIAAERGAPLTVVGRDVPFSAEPPEIFGQGFSVGLGEQAERYWTPLIGTHQATNGAVAVTALRQAMAHGLSGLDETAIRDGLRGVNWPGRFEIVEKKPWLVLDVAHNAASAERLRDSLSALFPDAMAAGELTLIFGAFSDKDVTGMFRALLPLTSHLLLIQAMNPRAFSTDQLAEIAAANGYSGPIERLPTAGDALRRARELAQPQDVICATGSLSVIGELRDVLGLQPARAVYMDDVDVQAIQRARS